MQQHDSRAAAPDLDRTAFPQDRQRLFHAVLGKARRYGKAAPSSRARAALPKRSAHPEADADGMGRPRQTRARYPDINRFPTCRRGIPPHCAAALRCQENHTASARPAFQQRTRQTAKASAVKTPSRGKTLWQAEGYRRGAPAAAAGAAAARSSGSRGPRGNFSPARAGRYPCLSQR